MTMSSEHLHILADELRYTGKSKPRALITGINGQDGSYLAEWLLHKGYEVHGIIRRASTNNLERIRHILDKITLHEGEITDSIFVSYVIYTVSPLEIYNLAAQSHVHTSFSVPDYTFRVNTLGLLNILEAVRQMDYLPNARIYQASTSEMFGNAPAPQGIETPFDVQSPYAISKLASHELIKHYRNTYDMYTVSGILFNHESPRRGENFVTRKITKYFGNVGANKYSHVTEHGRLKLGNIQAKRDWGFAPDYVQVMWQSLQDNEPKDFVLGTGVSISVKDFLGEVGEYLNLDWTKYVDFDEIDYVRPSDVNELCAKSSYKVRTYVVDLVPIMLDYENNNYNGQGYEYYMENYGDIFAWRT